MRILRLDLRAFGPFSGVTLDLAAGNEGFHLVYGPNEAGKSSALRALRNLLYGIPGNTSDHFLHDYRNLRIGATLARRDGQQLEIVRRKGNKGTLLPSDEKEPLEESVLHGFLGGCDQAQFETMFGIDHAGLIAGGRDIIRGQGDIGHVLFAAGAGIADLRTIRNNLEKQAEDLFSPRGLKPAVNQALTELHKVKKLIRECQLPSSEWQKHKGALDDTTKQLTAIEEKLGELSCQKSRLQRLAGALPAIGRFRDCDEKLGRLGDVPILPADFAENRRDTISRLETARQAEQDALTEIARLDGLIAALTVPEGLVSRAAEIESLYKELSVYRKAQADLPGLTANCEHLEKEAATLLGELRPELTLAEADQLKLSRRQQVEIQNLGNRREALEKQLAQARSDIGDSRQRLAEASDQLAQLSPPSDPAPLIEAIRTARSQGNLSQQAAALRAEIAALMEQAAIDLHKLGLWSGTLVVLEKLALPAAETIARFDRSLADAQAAIVRLQGQLEKARGDVATIGRDLERLRLEGEVPSEAELAEARRIRDAGWRLVLQDWRSEPIDTPALENVLAAGEANDLAAAYEYMVRRADDLSDRLRREANRVANRATLQAQQISLQQQTAELDRQHAAALEQLQQIDAQWRQTWHPAGIDPLPPREMQAWIQRQQALVQQAQLIRQRAASLAQLEEQIALHCRQVQSCLDDLTPANVRAREPSLDVLLARGDAILELIKDTTDSRRQLEREKNRLAKAVTQAEAKVAQAEADLTQWRSQWVAAIQPLGLPADVTPVAVNEVVAQTVELLSRLKEAAGFSKRIEDIGREALRFRQDVQRLLQTVDPDQPTANDRLLEAFEELLDRLRRAMTDQKNLDLLQSQRKEHERKRQQARSAVETLRARLAVLCQDARCQSPEGLPAAEAASAEVLRLRQEQEACHAQLLQLAAGATIDALMAEAAAILPDALPGELQQIANTMSDLERARDELRETIGGEKTVLAGMDIGAAATEAAEDAQGILARLEPDVQQYLRLRLASAVLREGIERYRKKNEGPVLGRASDLFRRLTLGSFEALRIDFDNRGEQVLAGVRPDGKTVLPTAMSEGTCDQLYLALRLASLEIWLQRGEPMPFIVDDILVSFDNPRAVATLKILAELSVQTQVIFFAHHEHLVDLATQCMSGEVLFVHRL
ncbi:MAG: AAA family ATPase [Thermoguttaceae bacterium]